MKLNLGDNIKKYRRQEKLTQEQLADKLGVSYQSVSRWENGTTYPDMELLPVLASTFHTTIDELLDMPNERKEQEAQAAFKKLAQTCAESPIDTAKIIEIIRDIRCNYIQWIYSHNFWLSVPNSVFHMPEVLPELRLTFEAIMESNESIGRKHQAIICMAIHEDDEHIDRFIEQYASKCELTKDALLSERYLKRAEWDKHDPIRQIILYKHIDQVIGNYSLWVRSNNFIETDEMLPELLAQNNLQLGLIHAFCNQIPDECHPVSANGEVDFWVFERIYDLGLRRVGYLASSGDPESAFIVLEDIVSLLEKAMRISFPTELRCASPWIDLMWTAEESWGAPYGNYLLANEEERSIYIHNSEGYCYVLYPSWLATYLTLTEGDRYTKTLHWLDLIRNDARYQACVDRVKALVVTRPKKDTE